MDAIGCELHDSLHSATDFSHDELDAVHRIKSLGCLVELFEVLYVFHAVVLQNLAQEHEILRVGLQSCCLEKQVENE